jgi:hypothetical protein
MSEPTDPSTPAPEPGRNQPPGPRWGRTPQPVPGPAATAPRSSRTGMLLLLGVVVIIAVVLLVHALMAS